ncbi:MULTISPECIES: IS66 family insertion sequence element accessory protein TnpB [unclassified Oceanispirochaeta]|uniref:IS66 family insertion sequence element accessory protein TnpB n=1 Tax=unclassified Oceanispirochaeta TaxID=2635722 RepID=UPI000E09ABFE|nr:MULTISPECIES: IS66 family insertion sequence element accessory protein TnpB [unclassified Oceanispirochaeta]MBF9017259.1 IS66 family insertion sequence element accessory protein TnpB [Oceanispirochaeta sp. M2]NPD75376.1 IS66 family insertion sequence element accessory protein TnpB [Oceanispirochaeta sp. M1]RDG28780.1 transposase [Oceanispirochaeta sp. M1]
MILDLNNLNIYVKPGITDMRKQINGLSILVEEDLKQDPFSGSLFLFCNKQKRLLKILYWDRNGFCLWLKRLEKDRFPWPSDEKEANLISLEQFKMLLNGIDFWKAHKQLNYTSVS